MVLEEQNVLFFTRTMKVGGTENVILQLCEIFKPLVNKIVVCSSGGVNEKTLQKEGIKHYTIPDIERKSPHTIFATCKIVKRIIRDEHITVIHTHHRMAAFYVAFLRLYKHCYFINTSHNTFDNRIGMTRFAYKHAKLIACGEMVKKNLVDVFGLHDVTVIHNAVKPFNGNIVQDSVIHGLHDNDNFVIANVGRLSEQKGMEYYIQAIPDVTKKHPKTHFLIIGSGEDEEKLRELAARVSAVDKVSFMGYRKDIQNLLSQVDLVVLSSLWEGLPLTPIEAFSVGRTIVATAVDGTVEIVKDKKNGILVEPKNVKQLSDGICWMLENERKQMEQAALETFKNEFSFYILAQNYIKAYQICER